MNQNGNVMAAYSKAAVISLSLMFFWVSSGFAEDENVFRVERVKEANILVVQGGHEVRLIGVDTPSVLDENENDVFLRAHPELKDQDLELYGRQAKELVKFLVEGKDVFLELDPQLETFSHRDREGRLLAYVWFTSPIFAQPPDWLVIDPKRSEGRFDAFLNPAVLRAGYGTVEVGWPFTYGAKFLALLSEARQNQRGLWANISPDENIQGQ